MKEKSKEDLEKRIEVSDKKVAELEGSVQEQLRTKIECGEATINQSRIKFGLSPINDEMANARITKVLSDNNKELD